MRWCNCMFLRLVGGDVYVRIWDLSDLASQSNESVIIV